MIRSTKCSIKFSNKVKLEKLNIYIDEYRKVIIYFIDKFWNETTCPKLFKKGQYLDLNTWLSTRSIQSAGAQASGIIRGAKKKQEKRLYQINKFIQLKQFKKARKLQAIYNNTKISKPTVNNIECELSERFVKINLENETSFDGWISLTSLGNKLKLELPFKKHKHFNKLLSQGKIKKGVRLSKNNITFMFELEDVKLKTSGATIGIDIGQTTTLSTSSGQLLETCPHGHTYKSICNKLARKKKDSKNFNKTVKHRSDFIHYIVNQLNLDGVKVVNRENIKNLRKFKNVSRLMKHWNYAELFDVLDRKLNEQGVLVNKLNPTYTSQRCSACGWVRKGNRQGKQFKCDKCLFEHDADLNAALNLSFNLVGITKQERLQHKNRKGFYWNVVSKEHIVPSTQKI